MYPILFRIGDFTVTSYGVMLVLAFVGAGLVVASEWKRRGWDPSAAQDIVLAAMVGGIAGSKLYWALDHWAQFTADPLATVFSRGGFTYLGGLAGGIFAVMGLIAWRGWPIGKAMDSCAIAIPVGNILGRVGCFLVGDDYGYATDVPWAVAFPEGSPPTIEEVHPTQIYEILMTLPIFGLLWWQRTRDLPDFFLFWEFCFLYGIQRFIIEIYRVNPEIALGLTAAQWLSASMVGLGGGGMAWVWSRARRMESPPAKVPAS